MRRILLLLLVGCGAKAAPARVPEPPAKPAHAQVVDVPSLDPPRVGFHFATTLHRDASSNEGTATQDGSWSVEYTAFTDKAPTGMRVEFDALTTKVTTPDGKSSQQRFALAGNTYVLATTAQGSTLSHEDGSPTGQDEQQAFVSFYGQGGAYLPGRDVLIGKKLEKGVSIDDPEAIPGIAMMTPPSQPTAAKLTLQGVDADGQATIVLAASGNGTSSGATISWTIDATLVTNADTLLPSSLTVTYDADMTSGGQSDRAHSALKQTFTYPAS